LNDFQNISTFDCRQNVIHSWLGNILILIKTSRLCVCGYVWRGLDLAKCCSDGRRVDYVLEEEIGRSFGGRRRRVDGPTLALLATSHPSRLIAAITAQWRCYVVFSLWDISAVYYWSWRFS
jgi:hypothetical protein